MLLIGIVAGGMAVGAIAQLLLGRAGTRIDWSMALATGIVGSFIGGLLVSLLSGDGLALRPSGLIGSVVGAVVATALWIRLDPQKAAEARRSRPRRSS